MKIIFKYGDGLVIMDVENPQVQYLEWNDSLQNKIDNYINPTINIDYTDIIEGATIEEIEVHKQSIYKELDIEYTKKISELVEKHVQKNILDGTPIPQEVLIERERLRLEFHTLINQ
jgi:hypothetical protein